MQIQYAIVALLVFSLVAAVVDFMLHLSRYRNHSVSNSVSKIEH